MRIVQLEEHAKQNILSNLLKRDPNNYDSYADTAVSYTHLTLPTKA